MRDVRDGNWVGGGEGGIARRRGRGRGDKIVEGGNSGEGTSAREREAPKIDAFSMQNSRSTRLIVAGQHATRIPLWRPLTILSSPLLSSFYLHHHLRHLRPGQNRERHRSR